MTDTEARVVEAWHQAAADLGIKFTSPFVLTLRDGRRFEYLGIVHQFGRRVGTVISVLKEPSAVAWFGDDDDYFTSVLGSGYGRYERQLFIDTLDDWQFFGSEAERPAWYSGKSWT
jgi:hypothetical protein